MSTEDTSLPESTVEDTSLADIFQPIGAKLLVRPDEIPKDLMVGSILIPDTLKAKLIQDSGGLKGTVVALGPGMLTKWGTRWPMPDCKPGDRILFSQYAGSEIQFKGAAHLVMRDDDVIGVIEEE